ncbi:MAG TPA: hypothetical protein VH637_08235 [Streptosporangiaceae bacterium]
MKIFRCAGLRAARLSLLAVALATATATGVPLLSAQPAAADPGHCWRAGSGPIGEPPAGFLYEINNICDFSIRVRIEFPDTTSGACKTVNAYGHTWYNAVYAYSDWGAENC